MADRYIKSIPFDNDDEDHKEVFSEKVISSRAIPQLPIANLKYPSASDIKQYDYIYHVWSSGDRLYKLADKYYKNANAWWVIAWFNKKPTEQHFSVGDVVSIPFPLSDLLETVGVF